ncbi:MAG TPA: hypothetical protein VGM93_08250, partial [Acidimicrobiales bacterium]
MSMVASVVALPQVPAQGASRRMSDPSDDIPFGSGWERIPWTFRDTTSDTTTVVFPGQLGEYTLRTCSVQLSAMLAVSDVTAPGPGNPSYHLGYLVPRDQTDVGPAFPIGLHSTPTQSFATNRTTSSDMVNKWNASNSQAAGGDSGDYTNQVAYQFFAGFHTVRDYTNPKVTDDPDTCTPLVGTDKQAAETGFSPNVVFLKPKDESTTLAPHCSVTSQTGPGGSEIDFGSSVDTTDPGYEQEWTFSDGTTSKATAVHRTATKPGPFTGTFRAWRPGT